MCIRDRILSNIQGLLVEHGCFLKKSIEKIVYLVCKTNICIVSELHLTKLETYTTVLWDVTGMSLIHKH